MRPARNLVYWTVPSLVLLALYWPGLKTWFQLDDFSWLRLDASVTGLSSLLGALFTPMAQGTIRPLSERGFFMLFHQAFGLWAAPFRAAVFATQMVNLVLFAWVARRVTGSRRIGFLAPLAWAINGGLATVMSWTSAYNQVLCAFFLLAALGCFIRYTETEDRRYLAAQWAAFLLGFGALEINAVYPAIAAAYALCRARPYLRKTWPMFAVSGVYTLLHFWVAPVHGSVYAMHLDSSILGTLWTYWQWALGPGRLPVVVSGTPAWLGFGGTALLTGALAAFVAGKLRGRHWEVLVPLAWFLLVLLPVLPLRDHVTDYYLTLPTAGVAWLLAWGLDDALRGSWRLRVPAAALVAIYVVAGILGGRVETEILVRRSYAVRTLVWGAVRVRQLHPGKIIVFTGLDSGLFWAGMAARPFGLVGVEDVYAGPEVASSVAARPEWGQVSDYILPRGILLNLLQKDDVVVYRPDAGRLRAVTRSYKLDALSHWKPEEPRQVNVGERAFASQLGPTWYGISSGHRWMPETATVRLGGPLTAAEKLYISGFCPAAQLRDGPLWVAVRIDGGRDRIFWLSQGNAPFHLTMGLPKELVGKQQVDVSVEVARTFQDPPDRRPLGLIFGTFEIRE
jgi:hypothetical protein